MNTTPECGEPSCERCGQIERGETCEPSCAGWYLDSEGVIRMCDACGLFIGDHHAGETVSALLHSNGHSSMREGWDVFSTGAIFEIERDDEARVFEYDDDAWPHAFVKLTTLTGCDVGPR